MWFKINNKITNSTLLENIEKIEFENIVDKASFLNREIFIDNLTPQIADYIDKVIRFWNKIDEDSAQLISEREPIKIYIDSYGGSLTAAFTIIDAIKISKTPVYTINVGTAHKESLYVFLAAERRFAYPRSSFLVEKDLRTFDVSEDQNYVNFCESQSLELKDMLLDKSKMTETEYNKRKNWWLNAEKAYELRICTEVLRAGRSL